MSRRFVRRSAPLVVGLTWAYASVAHAATLSWDGNGFVPPNGNFNLAANWDPNAVPGNADTAVFRVGSGVLYDVQLGSVTTTIDRLIVGNNDMRLSTNLTFGATLRADNPTTTEAGRGVVVGETASDTAAVLNLSAGTFFNRVVTLNAVAATIGDAAGSNGTINVPGAKLNITGNDAANAELIIGRFGSGTLNVTAGATVDVSSPNGNVVLGHNSGSSGLVTVSDAGSTLSSGPQPVIGGAASATGTLNVTNGGQVDTNGGFIGHVAGSTGSISVDGDGSAWTSPSSVFIGNAGSGSLAVTSGGDVTNASGLIGFQSLSEYMH
ncbi:MAG: hypothetical protein L0228_07755 [Planctomycetes bacterium]|nr:hypothetical protein [Planctomycetota bacterium]